MTTHLEGQKFERLLVIKRVERPEHIKRKRVFYLCKCDCGKEKIVNSSDLLTKHTVSCGCKQKENRIRHVSQIFNDLTGQKFGRLMVIERVNTPIEKNYSTLWLCECDCGNKKIINAISLRKGVTKSCGCYNREITSLPYGEAAKNTIYRNYKRGAKDRNIDFFLDKEEFFEIIIKDCYYCGEKPSNIQKNYYNNGNFIYNGIDRIDSSEGYIKGNVVPCCWMCNQAKSNISINDFDKWIEKVYKHRISSLTK